MQFPESWLRSFCNPNLTTAQLAETLTMAGLEVEDMRSAAPLFKGVVVGFIRAIEPHPNADKLRICQVDVGQAQSLQIVCGAPNARIGIRIPCAMIGAELPAPEDGKPFLIKLGQLRGVDSHGMLCSAKELHINQEATGLYELADDAPIGLDIRQYLNLDDTIFTLKLTPNLAHCLSVYGIARELSAITGTPLKKPSFKSVPATISNHLAINISDSNLCARFTGRVIKNINVKAKTPTWMTERLERCGQRSVNTLVDISNYVMFELGQPSHIFDLNKIHGGLNIRWGRQGESVKLLNGTTVQVDDSIGVIADESGVESLAGIMGGDRTSVSDKSTDIFIEAAFWLPDAIVGRSRRYNFSTDAGHRFERGVDPSQTALMLEYISQLVLEICQTSETQVGAIYDSRSIELTQKTDPSVLLRVARAQKIIGMPISKTQCVEIFHRLEMRVDDEGEILKITPPACRFDIKIEEDLIEELIRVIGFDALPHTPPSAATKPVLIQENKRTTLTVKKILAQLGYQETINFSFVEEAWEKDFSSNTTPIRLLNPIASQLSVMRSSLLGSLIHVLRYNQARKAPRVRIFEAGAVFERDDTVVDSDQTVAGFNQTLKIAALACGSAHQLQWGEKERPTDFYDVKGDIESLLFPLQAEFIKNEHPALHPGRCAHIHIDGIQVGVIGEIHPKWRQKYEIIGAPVLFELNLAPVLARKIPHSSAISKFQPIVRDIAVVISAITPADVLIKMIKQSDSANILQSVQLFDIYQAKNGMVDSTTAENKSLTLRLTFGAFVDMLTDAQIDGFIQTMWINLETELGASKRS